MFLITRLNYFFTCTMC